ncbi:hypothetical protein VTI74DRAFT_49 [Chaetomium olivicolor]
MVRQEGAGVLSSGRELNGSDRPWRVLLERKPSSAPDDEQLTHQRITANGWRQAIGGEIEGILFPMKPPPPGGWPALPRDLGTEVGMPSGGLGSYASPNPLPKGGGSSMGNGCTTEMTVRDNGKCGIPQAVRCTWYTRPSSRWRLEKCGSKEWRGWLPPSCRPSEQEKTCCSLDTTSDSSSPALAPSSCPCHEDLGS